MKIVVIDGQGGRLGALLIEGLKKEAFDAQIYAIGTNGIATAAMLKAGAHFGATGENPVVRACRDADYILGPIGIIAADAILGEITPAMAAAVGSSSAVKLLLPVEHCDILVAGVRKMSMGDLVREALESLKKQLE